MRLCESALFLCISEGGMRARALVIPALVEDTGDTLYPYFHFIVFVVRREARRRFQEAVLPHCEARGCSGFHRLQSRTGQVREFREGNAKRGEDIYF